MHFAFGTCDFDREFQTILLFAIFVVLLHHWGYQWGWRTKIFLGAHQNGYWIRSKRGLVSKWENQRGLKMLANELRSYPVKFGWQITRMLPGLCPDKAPRPQGPSEDFHGPTYFSQLEMTDWEEAHFKDACHYVRGGKTLMCPQEWKDVIPWML